MQQKTALNRILFLDIETVPLESSVENLTEKQKQLWNKKASYFKGVENLNEDKIYQRAGIYAEFGKIICISTAIVHKGAIRVKSYFGDNEAELLTNFCNLLNTYFKEDKLLCAHNGKEFDFPFLARRILVNGIKIPDILNISGRKPWEVQHIDTMQLWKFGDYKHYTSLDLLADIFNIPTPKNDIDGSQVAEVYYKDKDLNRIVAYCQKDVVTVVQLYQKLNGNELIDTIEIIK